MESGFGVHVFAVCLCYSLRKEKIKRMLVFFFLFHLLLCRRKRDFGPDWQLLETRRILWRDVKGLFRMLENSPKRYSETLISCTKNWAVMGFLKLSVVYHSKCRMVGTIFFFCFWM